MFTDLSPRLLALALAATAAAQTVVQVPCAADTTLYESATGALSNGVGSYLFAGVDSVGVRRRGLVSFDVAAVVPAGAHVIDASLFAFCSRWNGTTPLPVTLHCVHAPWGEGSSNASGQEGAGAPASPGDATWLHSSFPNTLWASAGGDFTAAPSGSSSTRFQGNTFTGAGMAVDVQSWLDAPATNFGWLLKTDEQLPRDVRRFDSRQGLLANRPVLTVTYLLPGDSVGRGTGCVGQSAQPFALLVQGTPAAGGAVQLDLQGGAPGFPAVQLLSLFFDAPGIELAPGCRLHLPPLLPIAPHAVVTLDASGAGTSTLPLPPGIGGIFFAAQAAALDPTNGFILSNAWVAVVR